MLKNNSLISIVKVEMLLHHCIFLASNYGAKEVVDFLIKHGAINTQDSKGAFPAHYAAKGGHLEVLKLVCKHFNHWQGLTSNGSTLLHTAVENNRYEVAKFLLTNKKIDNVNAKISERELTALHLAVIGGFVPLCSLLVNYADVGVADGKGRDAFVIACALEKVDCAEAFLPYVDPNGVISKKTGFTLLHIAAATGKLNVIKFLIERGKANPEQASIKRFQPIQTALDFNHKDVAEYLAQVIKSRKIEKELCAPLDDKPKKKKSRKKKANKLIMPTVEFIDKKKSLIIEKALDNEQSAKLSPRQLAITDNKKLSKKTSLKDLLKDAVEGIEKKISPPASPQKGSPEKTKNIVKLPEQPVKKTAKASDNDHFGFVDDKNRMFFIFPDHGKNGLSFGTYYWNRDDSSLSVALIEGPCDNMGSQVVKNHLLGLVDSKHVATKRANVRDKFHSFPDSIEKGFGHLACAVVKDLNEDAFRKDFLKRKYDISEDIKDYFFEVRVALPGFARSANFPYKKALEGKPEGNFVYIVLKKSLSDKTGLCVHRFFEKNK